MTAEVVKLVQPTEPTEVSAVLRGAKESDLIEIVIVGYRRNGSEYFASSSADAGDVAWHLQRGIFKLCDFRKDGE